MVNDKEIECPECGEPIGYTEDSLKNMVLYEDIICPECGAIVIRKSSVTYGT